VDDAGCYGAEPRSTDPLRPEGVPVLDSPHTQHRIGRYAWAAAWVGLVGGQLHALARHATADGAGDLTYPLTRFWAVPAADLLRPLLDWGDPDLVYVTYGKLWLPVLLAATLAAFVVRRHRRPTGAEAWAWRIALTGYVWACFGVAGDYWTQWTGTPNRLLDLSFVVGLPAIVLTLVGSSVLGITLLRSGFEPRASAWLLAATFPFALAVVQVTSMGSVLLPILFAFGIAGRRLPTRDHRAARRPADADRTVSDEVPPPGEHDLTPGVSTDV
jgi:hypothetical protein